MIRVVHFPVDGPPEVRTIDMEPATHNLDAVRGFLGGWPGYLPLPLHLGVRDMEICFDDDGLLRRLPPNQNTVVAGIPINRLVRLADGLHLTGPFFVARTTGDDRGYFVDLHDEDITLLLGKRAAS